MPNPTQTPTPAAMRAAKEIMDADDPQACTQFDYEDQLKDLADLIDRETGLPELLAALEQGLNLWPGAADGSRPVHPDVRMFVNAARAAIAKAKGGGV